MQCSDFFCPSEDSSTAGQRSFLGFASVRDLLRSKERLSLRTMDGGHDEEVRLPHLQMEEESYDGAAAHEDAELGDCLHSCVHDRENSPMMRAVLCAQVCKLYRFQTQDRRRLLVREQLWETPLSFSVPKRLLSVLIREHSSRVQEVTELSDLTPRWDGLRHDVVSRCSHMIGCYQETLAELDRLPASSCFKSSSSRSDPHLQFAPTNLHSQRMEVTSPDGAGVWYDIITFGAPADHHQSFRQGGLRRLLSRRAPPGLSSASYSRAECCRARELLSLMAQLQPLVFGLAEELLSVSLESDAASLRPVLDGLTQQTQLFMEALGDELVKRALSALHTRTPAGVHSHSNGSVCEQEAPHGHEDEWDRAWTNVGKILNCIIAMTTRLQKREDPPQELTGETGSPRELTGETGSPREAPGETGSPEELTGETGSPREAPGETGSPREAAGETGSQGAASPSSSSSTCAYSWQEQLLPLVVTLRDCVREAVDQAREAMTFVVLQGAAGLTVGQGPVHVVQRRHAVFSQALSAVVCGFVLKLHGGLEDRGFLQQLHSVGVLAQFESLLSTYGDELGMLEDMEVGVADLSGVTFSITEAKTEEPGDLLPTLSGTWGRLVVSVPVPPENFVCLPQELKGSLIRLHPVHFNIGINQQQSLAERFGDSSLQERMNQENSERLRTYCNTLRQRLPAMAALQSLPDLLLSLDRSVESRRRKNVEVLWIAALVCRTVNGVRLTSCKSAKDRTSMSVTLEQCVLLRERHALSQQHFTAALDCMRRDGCRMDNVQKNVGSRKFAFSSVQLLTFPKLYRPPDGSYG